MSEHQHQHDSQGHDDHDQQTQEQNSVKDPVCGMSVDTDTAKHQSDHKGKTWYFCSSGCQSKFDKDPEKYISEKTEPTEQAAPGTLFTCPMHPEIRQQGPGDCPICGMALEPEELTTDPPKS